MAHYVVSMNSPMAVEDAFAYMADVTHFQEWDPGVTRAVRAGPMRIGVGAEYDLTVKAGGTTVMRYAVTEYEAPRRMKLVSRTPFLTSVDEIRVDPTPHGCTVTYDARLTLNGPLRLFDSLLGLALNRIGDRAAVGLQRVLKVGSTVSTGAVSAA